MVLAESLVEWEDLLELDQEIADQCIVAPVGPAICHDSNPLSDSCIKVSLSSFAQSHTHTHTRTRTQSSTNIRMPVPNIFNVAKDSFDLRLTNDWYRRVARVSQWNLEDLKIVTHTHTHRRISIATNYRVAHSELWIDWIP